MKDLKIQQKGRNMENKNIVTYNENELHKVEINPELLDKLMTVYSPELAKFIYDAIGILTEEGLIDIYEYVNTILDTDETDLDLQHVATEILYNTILGLLRVLELYGIVLDDYDVVIDYVFNNSLVYDLLTLVKALRDLGDYDPYMYVSILDVLDDIELSDTDKVIKIIYMLVPNINPETLSKIIMGIRTPLLENIRRMVISRIIDITDTDLVYGIDNDMVDENMRIIDYFVKMGYQNVPDIALALLNNEITIKDIIESKDNLIKTDKKYIYVILEQNELESIKLLIVYKILEMLFIMYLSGMTDKEIVEDLMEYFNGYEGSEREELNKILTELLKKYESTTISNVSFKDYLMELGNETNSE